MSIKNNKVFEIICEEKLHIKSLHSGKFANKNFHY